MSTGIFRASSSIPRGWGRQGAIALLLGLLLVARAGPAQAACHTCTVTDAADLVSVLTLIDSDPGHSYVIIFANDITLDPTTTLPVINSTSNVTINGQGFTLDGGSVQRGFFVYQGAVAINNLTIQNAVAQGGTGGGGSAPGGGGGGLGGALFVASGASLSVSNVTLTGNSALGGAGANATGVDSSGGGGGMGGNGAGSSSSGFSGGGGGLGVGADGGSGSLTSPGRDGAAGIALRTGGSG